MTNRTIYVIGQGYNPTPVSVVATVDGNVVYNGTIATVNENINVSQLPGNTELQQQMQATKTALFSIEKDIAYNGTVSVNLVVTGGPVWFGAVIANYVQHPHFNPALTPEQQAIVTNPATTVAEKQQIEFAIANPPFSAEEVALIQSYTTWPYPPEIQALIVEHQANFYYNSSGPDQFLNLPDVEGDQDNTWSSVSINGVAQPINPDDYDPPLDGTWWWVLNPGDEFTGTLRIAAGEPAP